MFFGDYFNIDFYKIVRELKGFQVIFVIFIFLWCLEVNVVSYLFLFLMYQGEFNDTGVCYIVVYIGYEIIRQSVWFVRVVNKFLLLD